MDENEFKTDLGDDFSTEKIEVTPTPDIAKDSDSDTISEKSGKFDLFEGDVTPKKIDWEECKVTKSFTFAIANPTVEFTEEEKSKVMGLLRKLALKGYTLRTVCKTSNQLWDNISELFDYEKILIVKPWKKYCETSGFKAVQPSEANYHAMAHYGKNFNDFKPGLKSIVTTIVTLLFGRENKEKVEFILIYDPYIKRGKDNKIDYKKSLNTSNLFFAPYNFKEASLAIFNLADAEDVEKFKKLMEA